MAKYKLNRERGLTTEQVMLFECDDLSQKVEDEVYEKIQKMENNWGIWTLYVFIPEEDVWFDIMLVWQ